jgi:hypothetical protein
MCRRTPHLILIAVVGLAAVLLAKPAAACSCIQQRPACQAFWDPGAVFVGTVTSIGPAEKDVDAPFQSRRVRFEIVEPLRGVATSVVDVFTGMGGGDCGYRFVVGQRYLVYAYEAGGARLAAGICSRTRPLSAATEDLAYMRSLPATGALGATISGSVHHRDRNIATKPGVTMMAPVGSLGVVMDCEGAAYRGTTDADGRFTIAGVPVGSCTPRLESPGDDFLLTVNTINIPDPRACAEVSLMVGARKK